MVQGCQGFDQEPANRHNARTARTAEKTSRRLGSLVDHDCSFVGRIRELGVEEERDRKGSESSRRQDGGVTFRARRGGGRRKRMSGRSSGMNVVSSRRVIWGVRQEKWSKRNKKGLSKTTVYRVEGGGIVEKSY